MCACVSAAVTAGVWGVEGPKPQDGHAGPPGPLTKDTRGWCGHGTTSIASPSRSTVAGREAGTQERPPGPMPTNAMKDLSGGRPSSSNRPDSAAPTVTSSPGTIRHRYGEWPSTVTVTRSMLDIFAERPTTFSGHLAVMLRVGFLHPDLGLGGAERLVVDAASGLAKLVSRGAVFARCGVCLAGDPARPAAVVTPSDAPPSCWGHLSCL